MYWGCSVTGLIPRKNVTVKTNVVIVVLLFSVIFLPLNNLFPTLYSFQKSVTDEPLLLICSNFTRFAL